MIKKKISTNFEISVSGENIWYPMSVPGSAMDVFYKAGRLPDPYFGTNEYQWTEFFRNDFDVRGSFQVSEEEYEREEILLTFYGLDTIADIVLNGCKLGHTENMHRIFSYPVKKLVKPGENQLEIHFTSPIRYVESVQAGKEREIHFINTGSLPGAQYIRKAHSMFGWDWGPQLPDVGIFRKIELCSYDIARLGDILIRQKHENGKVILEVDSEILKAEAMTLELYSPEGKLLYRGSTADKKSGTAKKENHYITEIEIADPKLWWPNGYGSQPLYVLKVLLQRGTAILDQKDYHIGLRTMTVSREEDQWGQEFAIAVNGVKIFARGANYIPDDCFYSHITLEVLERDVKAAVFANFNCLRVWGGGYYPSEEFYDLCDRYGILVWQDLMYACNIYDLDPKFEENIIAETRDNLKRFRNHACLALICGNNEMESAWVGWNEVKDHCPSLKRDYLLQFEYILPKVVEEVAPDTFYWPSSPSSGGSFDKPDSEAKGDCHYWEVWHGQKPFSEYQKHYFRFCSEFGFQSLPSIRTIETFTEEKDRNLFTKVMESHQKNPAANGKILYYLSENFRYPKDLESLVFLSQILQGYAMKAATEHWRRNRGRCMGSIYWQFNDNWPVASWSSMDYYGRYKALHYMAKAFCDSVAGSIEKKESRMGFWISNETLEPVQVKARISVKTMDFEVLEEQKVQAEIPALTAKCIQEKDYRDQIRGREESVFLVAEYEYMDHGKLIHKKEFELFVPMKYMELKDPQLKVTENPDGSVEIQAKSFVPYCMVEGISQNAIWQENVFAVTDKELVILKLEKDSPLADGVHIFDVYHTY